MGYHDAHPQSVTPSDDLSADIAQRSRRRQLLDTPAAHACLWEGSCSEEKVLEAFSALEQAGRTLDSLRAEDLVEVIMYSEPNSLHQRVTELERENHRLKQLFACKICQREEALVGTVFLPCGHLFACHACARNLSVCPCCRETITNKKDAHWG